jgi:branched-chain amino acid transport system substrate-binding protein
MRKANYASVRGPVKIWQQSLPDPELLPAGRGEDSDGNLTLKTVATIVKDSQDKFHDKCR